MAGGESPWDDIWEFHDVHNDTASAPCGHYYIFKSMMDSWQWWDSKGILKTIIQYSFKKTNKKERAKDLIFAHKEHQVLCKHSTANRVRESWISHEKGWIRQLSAQFSNQFKNKLNPSSTSLTNARTLYDIYTLRVQRQMELSKNTTSSSYRGYFL